MVFRVTKSQSMKDELSFILYYMIILTGGWRVGGWGMVFRRSECKWVKIPQRKWSQNLHGMVKYGAPSNFFSPTWKVVPSIPHICHFWYATIFFKRYAKKVRKITTKVASQQNSVNQYLFFVILLHSRCFSWRTWCFVWHTWCFVWRTWCFGWRTWFFGWRNWSLWHCDVVLVTFSI